MEGGSREEDLSSMELVRSSCSRFLAQFDDLPATVNVKAAEQFGASLDLGSVRQNGQTLEANVLPASSFKSAIEEAAWILVMHALDFGSGWRRELHALHGKGAWQTIKPGVDRMLAAQPSLSSKWLAGLTSAEVSEFLFQDLDGSAVQPLISHICMACNEIGGVIQERGYATVSEWLQNCLAKHKDGERAPLASSLVRELVLTFPITFRDEYLVRGQRVCIYKKAQLVASELYFRFRHEDPQFLFPDAEKLTAAIDNVICAVLRHLGVIEVSSSLASKIDSHCELKSGSEEEVSLRAAGLVAVEAVVAATKGEITSAELGNYLWGYLGKTPEHRARVRHATKDTIFY